MKWTTWLYGVAAVVNLVFGIADWNVDKFVIAGLLVALMCRDMAIRATERQVELLQHSNQLLREREGFGL